MTSCGTILVVDHDETTRAAAVSAVARLGFRAQAVENSELVRDHLDGERPVLAIVEVELPGPVSGLELLRELHAAHGESLPVILVSGERTTPLDHVAGLLLGADDYVSKPFDEGELLARVRRSLSRAAGPSANRNGNGNGNGNGSNHATRNGETTLSPRELEILQLLSHGLGQAEIAQSLVLSPKTVGTHIQHTLSKLGVHSRAQAVVEAYRLGLVSPDYTAHQLLPEPADAAL